MCPEDVPQWPALRTGRSLPAWPPLTKRRASPPRGRTVCLLARRGLWLPEDPALKPGSSPRGPATSGTCLGAHIRKVGRPSSPGPRSPLSAERPGPGGSSRERELPECISYVHSIMKPQEGSCGITFYAVRDSHAMSEIIVASTEPARLICFLKLELFYLIPVRVVKNRYYV